MGPDAMILAFWMLSLKPTFRSPLSLSSRGFLVPLHFLHKGGGICISEVVDIFPGNLDFSLCFIHLGISHDVFCIKLDKQSDNMQPWCTTFLIWNQSTVACPVLNVASWPAYRFLRRQVRWSGIPISWRIFHSLLWSTRQRLKHSRGNRNSSSGILLLFHDPADVRNLITGSSAFSKSACTTGSSRFIQCWSTAWRILSMTLPACELTTTVR